MVKGGLGALGLGAVAAWCVIDYPYCIWVVVVILVFAALLFGGYYLWWRKRAWRQRERFSAAIEAQTAAAPKSISDPNSRAKLDQLRQKFQKGLQEYKSRGKDLYKLPWYVIIGEPGSGKTEALRHSGIEFPPGLQDELQGSGGTVNMDWWFTNRAVILDTAGAMVFNEARAGEAPEWREFLRLLKQARPHCPVNGLFLVLSVESLIKDSSDTIAQKASRLAQQLDLIQRTLDVRFPVYLLVTKCDLLTGFRDFSDSIEDPLLQHQIFGWSNPSPLDDHFRPDLVEQHLKSIVEQLRRRRLALLREGASGGRLGDTGQFFASSYQVGRSPGSARRLDEVDAMFALPESLMRLAPRLRRYLETIFVAGEWSAKPVFLRGIYFTTSMREGKALDEAIALATGLSLDQLPEDRVWEKNRAFFLRDLFHEKVFRESGLVTHATNTLTLLRTRQLAIFGTVAGALLLLLAFAWYGKYKLGQDVGKEAKYWEAGAKGLSNGVWRAGSIVQANANEPFRFTYTGGTNWGDGKKPIDQFHQDLRKIVTTKLSGGWIFKPVSWLGRNVKADRVEAQRILFDASVLKPLIEGTRSKMMNITPEGSSEALAQHKDAWLSLLQLEVDKLDSGCTQSYIKGQASATKHLKVLLAYLTGNDNLRLSANLVEVFLETYSGGSGKRKWPADSLIRGSPLANNRALASGLENFRTASWLAKTNIDFELKLLNELTDSLTKYRRAELAWANSTDSCDALKTTLLKLKADADASWSRLQAATNLPITPGPLINLASLYSALETNAVGASATELAKLVRVIELDLSSRGTPIPPLIQEVQQELDRGASKAGETVRSDYTRRVASVAEVSTNSISTNRVPAYELRWRFYTNLCAAEELANTRQWQLTDLSGAHNYVEKILADLKVQNLPGLREADLVDFRNKVEVLKEKILKALNQDLLRRPKFPVALKANPADSMTLDEVKALRVLVDGVTKELNNPIWQSERPAPLEALKKTCERYTSVIGLLVKEDGSPTDWEISFVGPKRGTDDYTIITIYTALQLSIGPTISVPNLTTVEAGTINPLGKGGVDRAVKILFKKLPEDTSGLLAVDKRDWGLLRLIHDNRNERLQDGSAWRIRIKLEDEKQHLSGYAVFEARPLNMKQTLPQFEDWLKD